MQATDPPAPLTILRQTRAWVVVDKPPGLLSVPGKGDEPRKKDCVPARVAARIPEATGPMIVHRLDMDTSGLMLVALNPDAQRALSKQFEERRVEKKYTALLTGLVEHAQSGDVDLPLRLDPEHRPWQVVCARLGRNARTHWRALVYETDRTRVEFTPHTGRAHQLRVHAATSAALGGIGHCIVGDVLYGSGYRAPEPPSERGTLSPAPRMMLHASYLAFHDPDSGERIEATSPAPF